MKTIVNKHTAIGAAFGFSYVIFASGNSDFGRKFIDVLGFTGLGMGLGLHVFKQD